MRAIVITALVFIVLLFAGLTQVRIQSREAAAQEKTGTVSPGENPPPETSSQDGDAAHAPDAAVEIHERTLNSFLAVVGPVSGRGAFDIAGSKSEYAWTVQNPRIEIRPGKAEFVADASVKAGPVTYRSDAKGAVEVKYDAEDNRISVKVLRADFEVYTKIFKKKIHIATVDVSKFYRPEFEFAGPQPLQESVPVEMPDGSVKTVYVSTSGQVLRLEEDRIVVASSLAYSDKPPAKGEPKPAEPRVHPSN